MRVMLSMGCKTPQNTRFYIITAESTTGSIEHHPDLRRRYNEAQVRITTNVPELLSKEHPDARKIHENAEENAIYVDIMSPWLKQNAKKRANKRIKHRNY